MPSGVLAGTLWAYIEVYSLLKRTFLEGPGVALLLLPV